METFLLKFSDTDCHNKSDVIHQSCHENLVH